MYSRNYPSVADLVESDLNMSLESIVRQWWFKWSEKSNYNVKKTKTKTIKNMHLEMLTSTAHWKERLSLNNNLHFGLFFTQSYFLFEPLLWCIFLSCCGCMWRGFILFQVAVLQHLIISFCVLTLFLYVDECMRKIRVSISVFFSGWFLLSTTSHLSSFSFFSSSSNFYFCFYCLWLKSCFRYCSQCKNYYST